MDWQETQIPLLPSAALSGRGLTGLPSIQHGKAWMSREKHDRANGQNLREWKSTLLQARQPEALTGSAGMKISTYSWVSLQESQEVQSCPGCTLRNRGGDWEAA